MNLPKKYEWLLKEPAPKLLKEALKLYGTIEEPGENDNKVILNWAKELKLQNIYTKDSVPWCGLFISYVVYKAGLKGIKNPLWALSWSAWGEAVDTAMLGDILVFTRNGGGHVGIYVGEDYTHYHVLGGNQSDSVCITRIAKTRLYAIRRTKWMWKQPSNIRVINLKPDGKVSENEA